MKNAVVLFSVFFIIIYIYIYILKPLSPFIWLNNSLGFCYRFAVIHARISSIWKIRTAAPRFRLINLLTCATLLLIIEPIGVWTAAASEWRGAVRRLSICERPSQQPFRRSPKGASWCGCRDHSDSFRWRTLLIVYLSAKAFHHFWCLRASCFNKLASASQSSASYFILLRILNKKTAFDLGD